MPLFNNERNTENVVRDSLRQFDYYDVDNDISVEEQKSNIEAVKRLLKTASKSGKGGKGAPEFIISSASTPDFLVIIECKANPKDHISANCRTYLDGAPAVEGEQYAKDTQRYAVDGALHYARKLSKEYNVIAVAVSGETATDVVISTYLHVTGGG
jgi:type I restriction enzyme M protein